MAQPDPKGKEEDEEEESVDLLSFFTNVWVQFIAFVHEHAHLLQNKEKEEILKTGINRGPELALTTLCASFTPEIKEEIMEHKEEALRKRAIPYINLTEIDIPPEVIERLFVFGEIFVMVIDKL